MGCHFLLQGIFLAQELNLHLRHWQVGSLPFSHQGSPYLYTEYSKAKSMCYSFLAEKAELGLCVWESVADCIVLNCRAGQRLKGIESSADVLVVPGALLLVLQICLRMSGLTCLNVPANCPGAPWLSRWLIYTVRCVTNDKAGYIMCGAQCNMKMWDPLFTRRKAFLPFYRDCISLYLRRCFWFILCFK